MWMRAGAGAPTFMAGYFAINLPFCRLSGISHHLTSTAQLNKTSFDITTLKMKSTAILILAVIGLVAAAPYPDHGGHSHGHGHQHQQHTKCHTTYKTVYETVYEDKCHTVYETSYKTEYKTDYKKECQTHYETIYEKACETSYKQECYGYGYDKKCKNVPVEQCHQVPKQIPRESCKDVPVQVPVQVPVKVPREICDKIPKQVPRQVPEQKCDSYGHGHSHHSGHPHH